MWLFKSSIGRKFIMALTGICLVLFVTFHVLMNAVAICWPGAYNQVCQFLGANWYALTASAGLGLLAVVHIIDAIVLTIQNRKARGNDRYAVNARPKSVEWSSQNMLVLGLVVVVFLGVHLVQFWARMQAQEIMGSEYAYNGVELPAAAGTLFLQIAFQNWWTPVIYIIGFIALWFHMNHGFWSMWHSIGWDSAIWLPRWKKVSCWWTTIVCGLFTIQAVVFTVRANENYYLTSPELQSQYQEMIIEHAQNRLNPIVDELQNLESEINYPVFQPGVDFEQQAAEMNAKRQRYDELISEVQTIQGAAMEQIKNIKALGNPVITAPTLTPAAGQEPAAPQGVQPAEPADEPSADVEAELSNPANEQ